MWQPRSRAPRLADSFVTSSTRPAQKAEAQALRSLTRPLADLSLQLARCLILFDCGSQFERVNLDVMCDRPSGESDHC